MTTTIINKNAQIKRDKKNAYSRGAWEGCGYDINMSIKDIAQIIRKEIKKAYPNIKASVRMRDYTAITISLMSAPFNAFETPDESKLITGDHFKRDNQMKRWEYIFENGHSQVNHYYLDDDVTLTKEAKDFLKFASNLADYFNYDDSDSMTDYFSSNFYLTLEIGTWEKSFIRA